MEISDFIRCNHFFRIEMADQQDIPMDMMLLIIEAGKKLGGKKEDYRVMILRGSSGPLGFFIVNKDVSDEAVEEMRVELTERIKDENKKVEDEGKEEKEEEYCDELLQTNHVSETSRQVVKTDKVSQNSEGQAENKTNKKKNRNKKVKIAAAALKTKTNNDEGMNIEVKSSSKDDKNDKEEKEKRLNKDVRLVEEKLSDHKARVEGIIANKATEMRILIVKIDKGEDAKMQCGKKANEIDSMVSQLEDRIKTLMNEKEEIQMTLVQEEKKLKKNIDKKKRLEDFIDKKMKEEKMEQLKIEGRLLHLKDEMGKTKSKVEIRNDIQMSSTNVQFSNFIVDKIQEKEKELECPVCLVVASPPIFSCAKQHLVCKECRPRLKECPECRAPYLEVQRHRYAERSAEELENFKEQKRQLETNGVGE